MVRAAGSADVLPVATALPIMAAGDARTSLPKDAQEMTREKEVGDGMRPVLMWHRRVGLVWLPS